MAKISQKEWNRYVELMASICSEAAEQFSKAVIKAGGYGNMTPKQISEIAYSIIEYYGEGTAALTASVYDSIAALQKAAVAPAELARAADFEDVAKAVNAVLRDYTDMSYMDAVVGKFVKQVGADTLVKNAIRDGAEVAWVPDGMTCAFCVTLASRGWETVSKRTLKNGHAEHIHPNCDCQYCVRFNDDVTVEGYQPELYKKMYYSADGKTPRDKINAMRREFYKLDKEAGEGTNNSALIEV